MSSHKPCFVYGIAYNILQSDENAPKQLNMKTCQMLDIAAAYKKGFITEPERELLYHDPAARLTHNEALGVDWYGKPICDTHGKEVGSIIKGWINGTQLQILGKVWDDEIAKKIRSNEYGSFSIRYGLDRNLVNNEIENKVIAEVSVCENPFFGGCNIQIAGTKRYVPFHPNTVSNAAAHLLSSPRIKRKKQNEINLTEYKAIKTSDEIGTRKGINLNSPISRMNDNLDANPELMRVNEAQRQLLQKLAVAEEKAKQMESDKQKAEQNRIETEQKTKQLEEEHRKLIEANKAWKAQEEKRKKMYVEKQQPNLEFALQMMAQHQGYKSAEDLPEAVKLYLTQSYQNEALDGFSDTLNGLLRQTKSTKNESAQLQEKLKKMNQEKEEWEQQKQSMNQTETRTKTTDAQMKDVWETEHSSPSLDSSLDKGGPKRPYDSTFSPSTSAPRQRVTLSASKRPKPNPYSDPYVPHFPETQSSFAYKLLQDVGFIEPHCDILSHQRKLFGEGQGTLFTKE